MSEATGQVLSLPMAIPNQWERAPLRDVVEFVADGDWVESKDQSGSDFRLLQISNIGTGCFVETGNFRYITEDTFKRLRCTEILAGDVLIARMPEPTGRAWFVNQLEGRCITAVDVAIVRPLLGRVNGRYLSYFLNTPINLSRVDGLATGTTRRRVRRADLARLEIPVPPIAEQRAIAGVLGALDDKIESNRRIWKTALQLISVARANAASVEVTHLKSLGQLADFNLNTTRPGPSEDKIVYIDIASVTPGSIEKRQVVTWSDAPSRARREVRDGDLIFSTVRPGRRSFAVILNPDPRTVVSTGFAVMTPKNCGTSFLAAVIADEEFADYCETVAQGSAYPAVSPEAMSRFEVEVPSVEALDKFESMYLPILRRGDRAQAENVILSNMRDALLPELLSGRLRVRDTEKFVEDSV